MVDPLSRRGYRFKGRATLHADDDVHAEVMARIAKEQGSPYQAQTVVLVDVTEIAPMWSPGYDRTPDERDMREIWKRRRAELDRGFEEHLGRYGHFRRPPADAV